jgi:hypothetical protein
MGFLAPFLMMLVMLVEFPDDGVFLQCRQVKVQQEVPDILQGLLYFSLDYLMLVL